MKPSHYSPGLSPRQQTLNHLLSGSGLASHDSEVLRKICVALAEDAENDDPDIDLAARPAASHREFARARPSGR